MRRIVSAYVGAASPSGIIYYSPGAVAGTSANQWEIWRVENDLPLLYWTPPEGYAPTCLFYAQATQKTYACLVDTSGSTCYLYEWAETETPTQVASFSTSVAVPMQAAEFDGQIYLAVIANASSGDEYIVRFDPTTHDISTVYTITIGDYPWPTGGGIGVAGGSLYLTDGTQIWSSADGASWSVYQDHYEQWGGDLVSDSATGCVYLGTGNTADAGGSEVFKIDASGAISRVFQGVPYVQNYYSHAACLTYLDSGGARSGPYAMAAAGVNNYLGTFGPEIFGEQGGVWSHWDNVPLLYCPSSGDGPTWPQGLVSTGGALYALLSQTVGESSYNAVLAKCTGSGSWTTVYVHSGRHLMQSIAPWPTLDGMTVSGTSRPCQDI